MAGQLGLSVGGQHVDQFFAAEQFEGTDAAFTTAWTVESHWKIGFRSIEGFGIQIRKYVHQQVLQGVLAAS